MQHKYVFFVNIVHCSFTVYCASPVNKRIANYDELQHNNWSNVLYYYSYLDEV